MQRDIILIFGQTGSGKTYLANEIAQKYPRVLVADAGFNEYRMVSPPEYTDLVGKLESLDAFGTLKPFHLAYDFRPFEFSLAFETALELGNCLLILEEADRFSIDEEAYQELLFRGRHYNVGLLLVSLHPRAIPTEVRRGATRIITFRQIFPDDIKWLAEIIGEKAFELPNFTGPPSKPPNPYIDWTPQTGAQIIGGYRPKDLTIKKPPVKIIEDQDRARPGASTQTPITET